MLQVLNDKKRETIINYGATNPIVLDITSLNSTPFILRPDDTIKVLSTLGGKSKGVTTFTGEPISESQVRFSINNYTQFVADDLTLEVVITRENKHFVAPSSYFFTAKLEGFLK